MTPERIVFSLHGLHEWGNADHHNSWEIDWRKPTVIIGDGPSRNDWIWNPKKVNLFAVNQACLWTACPFVTSRQHYDELLSFELPVEIPAVVIDWENDHLIYPGLICQANGPIFLSFLIEVTQSQNIYMQGFDCAGYTYRKYNFRNQVKAFLEINETAIKKGIEITNVAISPNHALSKKGGIIQNPPPAELLLDQWPGVNFDTAEAILERIGVERVAKWFRGKYENLSEEERGGL